jgi:glucose-1-phosphate thymidylyltransferase
MKKAVILAGGMGTRMQPATANINKHLLPVYSQDGAIPMIYYPITSLVKGGIKEILIISSREHCGKIIENLGDGSSFGARFTYKIQDVNNTPLGIASALKLAQGFTGIDPFAVILGDNFFEDDFSIYFKNFNTARFDAAIFLKEVEDPNRFGVYYDNFIEEKPSEPKSNLAVTGLYLYTNIVYQIANNLILSNRGELEITDINNYYCLKKSLHINHVNGFWSDMGTPKSLIATQEFINNSKYSINLEHS